MRLTFKVFYITFSTSNRQTGFKNSSWVYFVLLKRGMAFFQIFKWNYRQALWSRPILHLLSNFSPQKYLTPNLKVGLHSSFLQQEIQFLWYGVELKFFFSCGKKVSGSFTWNNKFVLFFTIPVTAANRITFSWRCLEIIKNTFYLKIVIANIIKVI